MQWITYIPFLRRTRLYAWISKRLNGVRHTEMVSTMICTCSTKYSRTKIIGLRFTKNGSTPKLVENRHFERAGLASAA